MLGVGEQWQCGEPLGGCCVVAAVSALSCVCPCCVVVALGLVSRWSRLSPVAVVCPGVSLSSPVSPLSSELECKEQQTLCVAALLLLVVLCLFAQLLINCY